MKKVITRELAKKLIRDYEDAIKECEGKSAEDTMLYLRQRDMDSGICSYSELKYGEDIGYDKVLVLYLCNVGGIYIYKTPRYWYDRGGSSASMIMALQARVNWLNVHMQQFLAEKKWWRFWQK